MEKVLEIGNRALKIMEARLGHDDLSVGAILSQLARVNVHQKKYQLAEPNLMRALEIANVKLGPEHPHAADYVIIYSFYFYFLLSYYLLTVYFIISY